MSSVGRAGWSFLSNHGLVLLAIVRDPGARLREIAARVGITERAVHRIVLDLEAGGHLERVRVGRRNRYEVHAASPMRHALIAHQEVGALMELLDNPRAGAGVSSDPSALLRGSGGEVADNGDGQGGEPAPGPPR